MMDFNKIYGLVLDFNYIDDFHQLQKKLGFSLEYVGDTSFEESLSKAIDKEYAYVYFSDRGTLFLWDAERASKPYRIEERNTLSFGVDEQTMDFNLKYCEAGGIKRIIREHDGEKKEDRGVPFTFEGQCKHVGEVVMTKIPMLLGCSLSSIPADASIKKFRIKYNTEPLDYPLSQKTEEKHKGHDARYMFETYIAREEGEMRDEQYDVDSDDTHYSAQTVEKRLECQAAWEQGYEEYSNEQLSERFHEIVKNTAATEMDQDSMKELLILKQIAMSRGFELKAKMSSTLESPSKLSFWRIIMLIAGIIYLLINIISRMD